MFTTDEVNECFDLLLDRGPRLIPVEVLEAMRSALLDLADPPHDDQ